jgi:hypothetical protein
VSALYLHETVPGGPGSSRPRRAGRRARTRRNLSDLILAVSVAVFLCSAVALRVLDNVPLALVGLPLGLGLLLVARAVDPPFAARRLPAESDDAREGETEPLPWAGERERQAAA